MGDFVNNGFESGRVGDGNVGENFAVQGDFFVVEQFDELGVFEIGI